MMSRTPTPKNSNAITALIAVDTDAVRARYPNPSQRPEKPTRIDHHLAYMIAAGTTINAGQGTGDLDLTARPGDEVSAFATSGSADFEDAVLNYGVERLGGARVFGRFDYQDATRSAIAPKLMTHPLPTQVVDRNFWFFRAQVIAQGTERCLVKFGLYVRDKDTGEPVLAGYYAWDPAITVRE